MFRKQPPTQGTAPTRSASSYRCSPVTCHLSPVTCQEEKEESSSGEQAATTSFLQTIQCDVTLKVNETIKVLMADLTINIIFIIIINIIFIITINIIFVKIIKVITIIIDGLITMVTTVWPPGCGDP